jgi:hypothetical protein
MNAHHSQQALERMIVDAGFALGDLTVASWFALMFEFYRKQRADDCPPQSGADMLLYQWGVYDSGLELDITRQFIIGDAEDENFWQLSLSFTFSPCPEFRESGSGNKWCKTPRDRAVDYFEGFVRESAAYSAVVGLQPVEVYLDYFNAG